MSVTELEHTRRTPVLLWPFIASAFLGVLISIALSLHRDNRQTHAVIAAPAVVEPGAAPSAPVEVATPDRAVVALEADLPVAPPPVTAPEPDPMSDRRELQALRERVHYLETELAMCALSDVATPLTDWYRSLPAEARPAPRIVRLMADYLRDYPVRLHPDEGQWLAERTVQHDWDLWGPSIDEAIIMFLGPARIAAEVSPEHLAYLREEWGDAGYFH